MNEAFEQWLKRHAFMPTREESFRAGMLAAAEMERSKGK